MKDKNHGQKTHSIVFEYFTKQIFDGKLRVGTRLPPEREISERLGVSRNSTREAVRMLEMMGFIESVQGSGNYIRCEPQSYMVQALHMMMVLRDTDDNDLFHARRAVEKETLALAMDNVDDEVMEKLHAQLLKMDSCTSAEEYSRLDGEFHAQLRELSGSELMVYLCELTDGLMDHVFGEEVCSRLATAEQIQAQQAYHWEIYNGLKERDGERIRAAAQQHCSAME